MLSLDLYPGRVLAKQEAGGVMATGGGVWGHLPRKFDVLASATMQGSRGEVGGYGLIIKQGSPSATMYMLL